MTFTDDPVKDYDRHSSEQDRKLDNLPICSECEEPIQDDMCYEINGEYICEECMDLHRIYTPEKEM
jgi:formylmethanofuran dehydrogenase subunit E